MSHFTLVLMSYAAMRVHTFLLIYINFQVVFKNPGSRPVINAALSSTSKYDLDGWLTVHLSITLV